MLPCPNHNYYNHKLFATVYIVIIILYYALEKKIKNRLNNNRR